MRRSGQVVDPGTPLNWAVIKSLAPFLKEFKYRTLIALICLVLAKLSAITLPFILKYLVDSFGESSVQAPSSIPSWALVPLALVFALGFFRFSNVVFGELRDTLFSRVTERAIRRISLKVFRHLHSLDVSFHLDRRTGGLARDIERGTHGINFLMRFMVFNIIPTLFEISLVIGILLTAYGWAFGTITLASIFCYGLFTVLVTNWRNKYIREANEADSASNTRAIDSLLNYETVKYFTNEEFESNRYDQDLARWEKAKLKNRFSLFTLNAGQALIISAAITALMYIAVVKVQQGVMTVGDLVLVNAFMMQLFMPLNFLGFVYREIRAALVNIEKMFGLLEQKPVVVENENATIFQSKKPISIAFHQVSFGYEKARQILSDVSFDIEAKQTVAIVGASGAGKSTIAKLLLRFYDPQNGKILFDGINLADMTIESLRASVGVIPQDTVLFNDSLYENIKYGKPDASDDEIQSVIKLAHLDEFVKNLPKGLETIVGERGLKLSGGEKQRVAIARALLKKPPVMIFDEATSSLDSHSEQAILSAINEISEQYTSVVIAHRLSTIVNADRIIVLDKGKIIETGNHHSLMNLGGHYASLWSAQQKTARNRE